MSDQYEGLSKDQLIALLRKRDGQKKLGLVWERDEIEADRAIDADFVACAIDEELSDKAAPWPNLVIEGDNFDALRWLRMTHAKRIKCIFIDPPYNTGNKDWVYNDHYIDKTDRWRHSTWLEFLFQRLTLARDLLADDGVLLISINDENRSKLDLLANEVMPGKRVGSFVWRTKDTGNDAGQRLSQVHEHVLIFAGPGFKFSGQEVTSNKFRNPDEHPKGDWCPQPLTKAANRISRAETYYPVFDPQTDLWYPCDPLRVWAYASRDRVKQGQKLRADTMEDMIDRGEIYFPPCKDEQVFFYASRQELDAAITAGLVPRLPKKKTPLFYPDLPDLDFWVGKKIAPGRPSRRDFLIDKPLDKRIAPVSSWIAGLNELVEYDVLSEDEMLTLRSPRGGVGGDDLLEAMGSKPFDNPKPVSLMRELVRQSASPGETVLDFFAGSATTAQAVMELNAEDGGERRFIMVSSSEATTDEPDKNICRDVTAERIRRLNAASEGKYAALSAPFAYLRTREIAFEDLDYELSPGEVWTALETLHDLPLTPHDVESGWQEHDGGHTLLVLVDRADAALGARLKDLAERKVNLVAYAWAPGQVTALLDGAHVDVRPVRDTLVRHFRQ